MNNFHGEETLDRPVMTPVAGVTCM